MTRDATTAQHVRQTRDVVVQCEATKRPSCNKAVAGMECAAVDPLMCAYDGPTNLRCVPERLRALVHARPPRVARSLTEARLQQLLQQHRRLPPVDCARECGSVVDVLEGD